MCKVNRRSLLAALAAASVRELFPVKKAWGQGFSLWEGGATLRDFPVFRQPDEISCGPTCCSMLLSYYGTSAGIGPLKTKAGTRWYESGAGKRVGMTHPQGIVNALSAYGLASQIVTRASLKQVANLIDADKPPILLVRSGSDTFHYVVAIGYRGNTTTQLSDPSGRKYDIDNSVLDAAWTFSGDLAGNRIQGGKCGTCGGDGQLVNWTCRVCSGSGRISSKYIGWTKCPACSGQGRTTAKCLVCDGDGRTTDGYRKAVEMAGISGHTMIVPSYPRRKDSQPSPSSGGAFQYTIKNDTSQIVRFRLPSGREYELNPGATGKYTYTGDAAKAKIVVHNSGKTYTLREGSHRFWWMANERRIGLDLAD